MGHKIFVTGANGRLGKALMRELQDATALVRKKSGFRNERVTDFSESQLKKILKSADVVIHLAGSRDFLNYKKAWKGNVELTQVIVNALPKNAKIIFASSISVYGKKLAKIPADEHTTTNPDTAYAKTKLEAEVVVRKHSNNVILRIGPVYGKAFEEYFKVLRLIEKGKMKLIGRGYNHIPFVHITDVVTAIKTALNKGNGIYIIAGESLTQREIFKISARALGVNVPKKQLSVFVAKMFSHLELYKKIYLGTNARFIPEDIAVLSSDRVFNFSKAKKELGFKPRGLKQGIQEMVKLYKQHYKA